MDFLFEIGLEELPSRYVDETEANLKKIMTEELTNERISFSDIESFSTPRRVAVIVKNIAEKQQDLDKKSVGPSIDIAYKDEKLTKAGEGFIKSQNASESDVKIVENEKGKYISIETFIAGKATEEVLPQILDTVIRKIEFEKSMKWSDRTFRFARPIKWFVTLLGDKVLPFEFEGTDGKVAICPMPFSEPRRIGEALFADVESTNAESTDTEIADIVTPCYEQNCESALNLHNYDQMYQAWSNYLYKQVPKGMRSIAISHAFVMGGEVGGSERTLSVGGSEQVNPQVYKDFHYTALGHLHGPQRMGADHIRYSGSPLKYSFDEHMQKKSFTIIDMDTKGNVDISTIPVEAKRDVVILEGYFEDLLNDKVLQAKHRDEYVQARLLDTMPIMDGMAKLHQVYHRCMTIDLVGRVAGPVADMGEAIFKELNERDLFNQFAETVWKEPLTEKEQQYINSVWDRILKED